MVLTPNAADKWLKLESLQIDKSQFLITGRISFIDKLSNGIQYCLYLESSNLFNISCSSESFPVAKKKFTFFFIKNSFN